MSFGAGAISCTPMAAMGVTSFGASTIGTDWSINANCNRRSSTTSEAAYRPRGVLTAYS